MHECKRCDAQAQPQARLGIEKERFQQQRPLLLLVRVVVSSHIHVGFLHLFHQSLELSIIRLGDDLWLKLSAVVLIKKQETTYSHLDSHITLLFCNDLSNLLHSLFHDLDSSYLVCTCRTHDVLRRSY